jgi:hypothetical protein
MDVAVPTRIACRAATAEVTPGRLPGSRAAARRGTPTLFFFEDSVKDSVTHLFTSYLQLP